MTGNPAELERVLAGADPARTPRDAAPDTGAVATRDRILHRTDSGIHRHLRAAGWASTAVAAVAAAVFVVAMLML